MTEKLGILVQKNIQTNLTNDEQKISKRIDVATKILIEYENNLKQNPGYRLEMLRNSIIHMKAKISNLESDLSSLNFQKSEITSEI